MKFRSHVTITKDKGRMSAKNYALKVSTRGDADGGTHAKVRGQLCAQSRDEVRQVRGFQGISWPWRDHDTDSEDSNGWGDLYKIEDIL